MISNKSRYLLLLLIMSVLLVPRSKAATVSGSYNVQYVLNNVDIAGMTYVQNISAYQFSGGHEVNLAFEIWNWSWADFSGMQAASLLTQYVAYQVTYGEGFAVHVPFDSGNFVAENLTGFQAGDPRYFLEQDLNNVTQNKTIQATFLHFGTVDTGAADAFSIVLANFTSNEILTTNTITVEVQVPIPPEVQWVIDNLGWIIPAVGAVIGAVIGYIVDIYKKSQEVAKSWYQKLFGK